MLENDPEATPAGGGQPAAARPAPGEGPSGLSPRDAAILAFEARWWRTPGAKAQAIKDTFGLSTTRYHQALNRLLDSPAALAAEPVLVSRLRRIRESRRAERGGGFDVESGPDQASTGDRDRGLADRARAPEHRTPEHRPMTERPAGGAPAGGRAGGSPGETVRGGQLVGAGAVPAGGGRAARA